MVLASLIVCLYLTVYTEALNNGLALTPPMGWTNWERYRCNIDCKNYPDSCINENLIKTMADHIVSDGYKDVGYEYVCLDDCWPLKERGPDGKLIPDPERFPNGIKALADYVHSKGLKFGIYGDFGHETCGLYPGSEFYLKLDAQTFADWGVDLFKMDTCFSNENDFIYGFPAMEFFLNQTGRPILFACEWPHAESKHNWTAIRETCNTWRTGHDMEDSWDFVFAIIEQYTENKDNFSMYGGPGGWNDPNSLVVGDYGLSYEQERAQIGMWAMFASPVWMSVDLRNIRNTSKALLQNKNILAINQDPLGHQGTLKMKLPDYVYAYTRPLSNNKVAVALLNKSDLGKPSRVVFSGSDVGLTNANGYNVTDGFTGETIGHYGPTTQIALYVNPTGIVLFVATPK